MASQHGDSSIWGRVWLALLLCCLFVFTVPSKAQEETKMDPYESANWWVLLKELDATTVDGTLSLEATTPRMFAIFYNPVTNRIVILGDDDGKKEIPAFSAAHFAAAGSSFIPLINQDGDMDTTYLETTANPLIDIGISFPQAIRWPADNAKVGDILGVGGIISETARDGTTSVNRATLEWSTVSHRVENSVYVGDMNVGTKQNMFLPASGETWIVDWVEVSGASTSLTTVQFSMGQNANADDWVATDSYTELVDNTVSTTIYPKKGKKVVTNASAFGIKCTMVQGAAATLNFEIFGHRIQ